MAARGNDPVFETVEVEAGGTTYTLRELTAGEYDECLTLATAEDGNVDMVLMVKLMLTKSIDGLSDQQLMTLPYKISRALKREVSRLHWAEDQEEVKDEAETGIEEEGAGPNP